MHFNAVPLTFYHPFVLEQGQMLGNRGLGQVKTLPDMFDITLLRAEAGHDLESDRMSQNLKDFSFIVEHQAFVEFHWCPPVFFAKTIYINIWPVNLNRLLTADAERETADILACNGSSAVVSPKLPFVFV